jgi:putative transposase
METSSTIFYRRRLPHYQPSDATFFITTRLAGSLPVHVIAVLREEQAFVHKKLKETKSLEVRQRLMNEHERRYFGRFDEYVNHASTGPKWLAIEEVAEVVAEAAHFRDGKVYELLSYTIMPNHIHLVFTVRRNDISLYRILQSLKRHSAREGNKILNRTGAFWHHESYDHVVRDGAELERIFQYVLLNPVKAGLCKRWKDWKQTYIRKDLRILD